MNTVGRVCAAWMAVGMLAGAGIARGQATRPAEAAVWNPATRPAFVIACYQQPVENLATWRGRGCNAVVGPEVGNPARLTARQWCEAAAREGLWVIGNRQLLEAGYRPPNLLAWALDDEPNSSNHNTPPAAVRAQAEAFRKLGADVPVWLNLAGDRLTSAGPRDAALYDEYCAAADVVSEDWYPINREFARYPIALKGRALEYLSARGARSLWSVVECNWQKLNKGSSKGRGPTPDEIEESVNLAVAKGARGIVYFSTCDSGAYGWPASYDPTEAAQAGRIREINARLAGGGGGAGPATQPGSGPGPVPEEVAALRAEVAGFRAEVALARAATAAVAARQERVERGIVGLASDLALQPVPVPTVPATAVPATGPVAPPPSAQPVTRPATAPATQPAARAAAAPVYLLLTGGRVEGMARLPGARHVNWLHLSLWNSRPDPVPVGGASPYDIPLVNARWIGRLCAQGGVIPNAQGEPVPFVPGVPIMVDFETHYNDGPRPIAPARWERLRNLIREIRKAAPGVPVVLYGTSTFAEGVYWQKLWNDGNGPDAKFAGAIREGYAPYQILYDEVDAVVVDFCVLDRKTGLASLGADRMLVDLLRRASGKPVWGLVDPNYRMEQSIRMPAELARANLAAARSACDAVVIWSGYDDARATYLPLPEGD